jgi:uncharacterized membrane protein
MARDVPSPPVSLFFFTRYGPPVFVAGVLRPLVGADLLHLKVIGSPRVGVLSIGGAGIALSGIVSAYLA